MVEETNLSYSVARLQERVQGTRKIDLGETARSRRMLSLRELRMNVVEAKRSNYFKRLQQLFPVQESAETEITDMQIDEHELEPEIHDEDIKLDDIGELKAKEYCEEGDDADEGQPVAKADSTERLYAIMGRGGPRRHNLFPIDIASVFTTHEFLVATDTEIREEALALKRSLLFVRPEGHRVLVKVNNFWATEYTREGRVRHRFSVPFTKGPTVLDCIVKDYDEQNKIPNEDLTYFVIDVLMYNGCMMANADTECRTFFLKSRLEESGAMESRPRFVMVEYQECNPMTMRDAYYRVDNIEYDRDSIVFVDKSASYVGGYNPNWLCWRDENTTKYIRISKNGLAPARVICDHNDRMLKTLDGVVIGQLPKKYDFDRDKITTILIKSVDISTMTVKEFKLPTNACRFDKFNAYHTGMADSLRKIVRRFMLDNQLDLDSEGSYNRLVDAVAAA
ncbi:SNURPORTIN1 (RNUT1 PROTEIN) (RNA, U TRANSPORTER 1), putative [Babesia bigemina]|uniref:Snurportin-1 n=1 Tax=Babesia bigemina TaxID=5866 RepID=A0A061D3N7_BABBI|nr:SNURPORTIN1 (RNUT1 PROTEIN) (RNA, U TRANSPORTER 1), putative [Babesia bigemina]CDR94687.1 SNURPORTIN1 (RNUT1 PROTEIN) (RNA, U TRANSPORTER 1), putative [Babesia bigemina]|eukprot:XP_012766873.1 SNURPORTIN1 (RNUT1 PROTEIN) (RNA, U TRANSPORTER 1), putative [Babesia bigemina]